MKFKAEIDIMPLKSRIKVKYQKSGTPTGNKAVDKARKRVEELEKRLIEDYGYTKGQLQEIGENIIGKKEYKKLTVSDIERYEARLNILGDKYLEGKPKKLSVNESKVEEIETQYDISVEQRDKFFKAVYNTTLEKANDIKTFTKILNEACEKKKLTSNLILNETEIRSSCDSLKST